MGTQPWQSLLLSYQCSCGVDAALKWHIRWCNVSNTTPSRCQFILCSQSYLIYLQVWPAVTIRQAQAILHGLHQFSIQLTATSWLLHTEKTVCTLQRGKCNKAINSRKMRIMQIWTWLWFTPVLPYPFSLTSFIPLFHPSPTRISDPAVSDFWRERQQMQSEQMLYFPDEQQLDVLISCLDSTFFQARVGVNAAAPFHHLYQWPCA